MPTPDDYYYEPGQRPYYTPAAYRPPPRDPRDNVDPNSYVYQPVPEGPATPGTGSPGATSGRNEYHGHPTAFAQQILNGQQPSTAPPAPRQQPPTPAQAQPAFPGVTAAPPPATPPRGTWGQPEGVVPPPALTPQLTNRGNAIGTRSPRSSPLPTRSTATPTNTASRRTCSPTSCAPNRTSTRAPPGR